MSKDIKLVESCRICENKSLIKYLDLGNTPLANAIITKDDLKKEEKTYPLEVIYCPDCHLSQLSIVVNPKIMFSDYPYRSSISKTFTEHCKEIANICHHTFSIKEQDLIVDIASNDGCLLQEFKANRHRVLGIDPATNLAKLANSQGIETINAFWNKEIAEQILQKKGHAKIIIATNVFAHVDNLNEFTTGIKILLDKDGVFIIEAPHALNLIKNTEFDTIYHEHLSYLLVSPLKKLFERHDMKIFRADETPIHGGSIRIFVCHNNSKHTEDESVNRITEKERNANLYNIEGYKNFSKRVEKIKSDLTTFIEESKNKNKTIAAYGASAKGNTLLNYCKIKSDSVKFIADDTPEKQNHYAPGSHIPIVDSGQITIQQPDYLLLLAWNFAKELMKKTTEFEKNGGKYLIPIPEVKTITSQQTNNA